MALRKFVLYYERTFGGVGMGEFTFRIIETVNQAVPLQADQQLHMWTADWWIVIAQIVSAVAIIIAAFVAGSFQKRKEDRLKKTQRRYYLTGFRIFYKNMEAYYFDSLAENILPPGFTNSDLLVQIKNDYSEMTKEKKEIIKWLPSNAMDPFQRFLDGMYVVLNQKAEDDKTVEQWEFVRKKLIHVIELIRIHLMIFPHRQVLLFLEWRKKVAKRKKDSNKLSANIYI